MKKIIVFSLAIALTACEESKKPQRKVITIQRVILDKQSSTETDYKQKFNVMTGDFVLVPYVYTEYTFIFTDGTTKTVDIGEYSIKNLGDTITETKTETQY